MTLKNKFGDLIHFAGPQKLIYAPAQMHTFPLYKLFQYFIVWVYPRANSFSGSY